MPVEEVSDDVVDDDSTDDDFDDESEDDDLDDELPEDDGLDAVLLVEDVVDEVTALATSIVMIAVAEFPLSSVIDMFTVSTPSYPVFAL